MIAVVITNVLDNSFGSISKGPLTNRGSIKNANERYMTKSLITERRNVEWKWFLFDNGNQP